MNVVHLENSTEFQLYASESISKMNGLTQFGLILQVLVSSLGDHVKIGPCTLVINPACPDPTIKFYLYTRKNQFNAQLVTVDNITDSYFHRDHKNKLIIHGFNSGWKLDELQNIKDEYIKREDVNVWMIDYGVLSAGPLECYPAAVYNLRFVGICSTSMVKAILNYSLVKNSAEALHIIGFSLGAHMPSHISRHISPIKLSRITGLDPALPLFYGLNNITQLSKHDADFVDVIHTNSLVQGQVKPCGHVDFYVNGGITQPACDNSTNPSKCNHHMAPRYFAESINSIKGFWAWPCSSIFDYYNEKCPVKGEQKLMGESCDTNSTGYYVLDTYKHYPYAMGKRSDSEH
ncbi:pancreatic lipase-related protein 2-like isoform X2 [Daktulosphaira vitifoliae]|nr:pancreatic lipase-related protein 2-like isoform X2 [Daktulosphaira vitifoliae]